MPNARFYMLLSAAVFWFGCAQFCSRLGLAQSGETKRVLIAVQNATGINSKTSTKALAPALSLQFVNAQTDTPSTKGLTNLYISGWTAAMPVSIQNFPTEHTGAVYSEDGSFNLINYSTESVAQDGAVSGLKGPSSAILIAPGFQYVFAANQQASALTVIDRTAKTSVSLNLPGVNRVFVNPGGTIALAFSQNTNSVYYVRKLSTSSQSSYSGGPSSWPSNAVDCEPQNLPTYCLLQFAPEGSDATTYSNSYFDHPYKALSSSDGTTIYILNPGPEYGGTQASVTQIPASVVQFQDGLQSGSIPTTLIKVLVPGGASNAVLATNSSGNTALFVAGEAFASSKGPGECSLSGNLSQIDLSSFAVKNSYVIADGHPTRMLTADDNTLWIGSRDGCNDGLRFYAASPSGCLTAFKTSSSSNNVVLIDAWNGDVTGLAAITGLHKVYYAEGGSIFIRSTTDPTSVNTAASKAIAPAGTVVDVAYMDSNTDSDNTVN